MPKLWGEPLGGKRQKGEPWRGSVRVGEKGRIVLPLAVRRALGVAEGEDALVALDGGSRAERQAAAFVRERVGGAVRTPRTYAERERAARVQAHADRIARAMAR